MRNIIAESRAKEEPVRVEEKPVAKIVPSSTTEGFRFSAMDKSGNEIGAAVITIEGDDARIEDIFVAEEHRRQGVGTVLVEAIKKQYPDITTTLRTDEGGEFFEKVLPTKEQKILTEPEKPTPAVAKKPVKAPKEPRPVGTWRELVAQEGGLLYTATKKDFPDLAKELAGVSRQVFRSRDNGGLPIDERADQLQRAGYIPAKPMIAGTEVAADSYLREMLAKNRKIGAPREAELAKMEREELVAAGAEEVPAGGLEIGDRLTIHGEGFRVTEKTGAGVKLVDGKPITLDPFDQLAIDEGSLKRGETAPAAAEKQPWEMTREEVLALEYTDPLAKTLEDKLEQRYDALDRAQRSRAPSKAAMIKGHRKAIKGMEGQIAKKEAEHKDAISKASRSGELTPERAEELGHFEAYPDLRPVAAEPAFERTAAGEQAILPGMQGRQVPTTKLPGGEKGLEGTALEGARVEAVRGERQMELGEREKERVRTTMRAQKEGIVEKPVVEPTLRVIPFSKTLDIRNIEALPRGRGLRYLEVIEGPEGEFVAKQWRRKPIEKGILVDFEQAAQKPAEGARVQEPVERYGVAEAEAGEVKLRKLEEGETPQVKTVLKKVGTLKARGTKVESTDDVAFLFSELENAGQEKFFVLCVGGENEVLGVHLLHMGTLDAATVDPGEVLHSAATTGAKRVYVVHNHPSGNVEASGADYGIHNKIRDAIEGADIEFAGQVIIDHGAYGFLRPRPRLKTETRQQPKVVKGTITIPVLEKWAKRSSWRSIKITSPGDVAAAMAHLQHPKRPTVFVLCLSSFDEVNRVAVLGSDRKMTNLAALASDITIEAREARSPAVVIVTDFDFNASMAEELAFNLKETGTNVIDVMAIGEGKPYVSAQEQGLIGEPGAPYLSVRLPVRDTQTGEAGAAEPGAVREGGEEQTLPEGAKATEEDVTRETARDRVPTVESKTPPSFVPEQAKEVVEQKTKKPPKKEELVPDLQGAFDRMSNDWFGGKDWEGFTAKVEAQQMHELIADYQKAKPGSANAILADMAIMLYRDTKGHPEKIQEFNAWYDALPESERRRRRLDKAALDLSQNLSDDLKAIADEYERMSDTLGGWAKEEGIIHNVIENHVNRLWDLKRDPGKTSRQQKAFQDSQKFARSTRHARQRKLPTIVDGWIRGYELKVKGITNAHALLEQELKNVHYDKQMLRQGLKLRNTAGDPLFSTTQLPGYEMIEHHNFQWWRFKKKLDVEPEEAVLGRNVIVTEDGTILEGVPVYAPAETAQFLNNVLGRSELYKIPGVAAVTKYNALFKSWILQSAFFHHLAFARSYELGVHKHFKDLNPRTARKQGGAMIRELHPLSELGVRNGLTLGVIQDWDEHVIRPHTGLGRMRQKHANRLFGVLGAGLKMKAFSVEYMDYIQRHYGKADTQLTDEQRNKAAARVAALINDDFGGLHLKRMGRNPTLQHFFRLAALAPDWTESNIRTVLKAIPYRTGKGGIAQGLKEGWGDSEMYHRFWAHIALYGALSVGLANLAMMAIPDEEDKKIGEKAKDWGKLHFGSWRNFRRLRWMDVDITPLLQTMGVDTGEKRKYLSLVGHFKDPVKWALDPSTLRHKLSVVGRIVKEGVWGTDWAGRPFTSVEKLRKTGKTVGLPWDPKVSFWDRAPSYLLRQVVGTQPIPVQSFVNWIMGEMDAVDGILRSLGLATGTLWLQSPLDRAWENVESARNSKQGKEVIAERQRELVEEIVRTKRRWQRVKGKTHHYNDISDEKQQELLKEIKPERKRALELQKKIPTPWRHHVLTFKDGTEELLPDPSKILALNDISPANVLMQVDAALDAEIPGEPTANSILARLKSRFDSEEDDSIYHQLDVLLDAAIAGTPTADSIFERVRAVDQLKDIRRLMVRLYVDQGGSKAQEFAERYGGFGKVLAGEDLGKLIRRRYIEIARAGP